MNTITRTETQALARVPYFPRTPLPSWKTMEFTLRQWHEDSLNDPEYLWMAPNFEDMADTVSKAVFCCGSDMRPRDDSWLARQEKAA